MKKVQVKKIIFLMLSALLLMGCKKNDGPVIDPNMEQPVLGEDAEGYGGFTYLQAYSFGEEGGNSVLYLPKDENAYVGKTTMICKTEGVEVTVNYNPTVSDEVADKTVRDKLEYILDTEYSDIYTESFVNFERKDADKRDEDIVVSSLSYLVYSEEQKGYVANWVEQYYAALPDGREFRITVKVDSLVETPQSGDVIKELEQYLNADFIYEEGMLQAKMEQCDPGEVDQIKMDGVQHSFGPYTYYLPAEWQENEITQLLWNKEELKSGDIAVAAYSLDARDQDPQVALCVMQMSAERVGVDASQFGLLSDGEMQVVLQEMEGNTAYMDGKISDADSLGYTDEGFVLKVDFEGYKGFNGRSYEVYYGDNCYQFYICIKDGVENKEEYIKVLDDLYQTLEIK